MSGDTTAAAFASRAGAFAMLGLMWTACGDAPVPPADATSIVVGMRNDFGGFNPITNTDLYTGEVINYALFTPLLHYDASLNPVPHLAESWVEEGDTAVVMNLRRDVRWHDGEPVSAHDVAFTFERAKAPASASLIGSVFLPNVAAAAVIDSFTIRFSFERPHAQALEDFWWAPAPAHLLRDIAPAELRNASYNRRPVGSGPFRFVEWVSNERLVLESNPDYPESLGGPPASARVVFRVVSEASTLLSELITGGIAVDVPVRPEQFAQIRADPSLRALSWPGRTLYYIGWNNERPPLDDPVVRRALALAIDRQTIIEALLYGQGSVATSPIPPWSPVHPSSVQPLERDSAEAVRLLERAGWSDRDGDGVRENADGQPLRFTILASNDQLRRSVVEVVQSHLAAVGVTADIRIAEFQTMIAAHRGRDFDAIFTNWILDNFQVAAAPFALFHSTEADKPGSANRSTVRDPMLDSLIDRAIRSTDADEQQSIWRDMTQRLQETQPLTFMFWLNELAAYNGALSGVTMDPRGELLTIARWSLRQ
jgi:peptide/nickel transport system substrate-binding protein